MKVSNLLSAPGLFTLAASLCISANAITNGQLDGDAHPNVGAIVLYATPDGGKTYDFYENCSGTFIGDSAEGGVFLTAGHCLLIDELINAGIIRGLEDIYVSFNPSDCRMDLIPVKGMSAGPGYPGKDNVHTAVDVGVLYLDFSAVNFPPPAPAQLPEQAYYLDQLSDQGLLKPRGKKFTAVGFGSLLTFPPPVIDWDNYERWASESAFRALAGNFLYMSQAIPTGNGGTAGGDSGGSRFWKDGDRDILVAITSRGDPACVAHDAAQRIDLPVILDWLRDVILSQSSAP